MSLHADVVALKGSFFTVENTTVTDIFQRDLLCNGNEENLLSCPFMQYETGARDCPMDHSEDAGVKCNGKCNKNNVHSPILYQSAVYSCK